LDLCPPFADELPLPFWLGGFRLGLARCLETTFACFALAFLKTCFGVAFVFDFALGFALAFALLCAGLAFFFGFFMLSEIWFSGLKPLAFWLHCL
jgi:hypothetical protein